MFEPYRAYGTIILQMFNYIVTMLHHTVYQLYWSAQHSPYGRKIQIGLRKNLKRRLSEWQVNRIQGKLH